ncbi:MAG TPA: PfkB family carbohydrate kinase, partial [Terriglobia bacterium]|nr:PfkB family carbohydrate kinase [Terriglobia bacterium]
LQRKLRPDIPRLLQQLKQAGLTISLDTNDDPDDRWSEDILEALKFVDVFFPNERELKKIARTDDFEEAIGRIARMVPVLVVKRGAAGAIAQRGEERFTAGPLPVTPVDPVGAGDSFDAGFLSEHLRGADLPACLAAGNLAGAFSTTRPGGTEAFRDRSYLERFWREHTKTAT